MRAGLRCVRRPRAHRLPRLGVLAGRDDGGGVSSGNCLVTLPGFIGAVCRHGTNLFVCRDLVEQVRQDGCIPNVAPGDLDGSNLQRLFVDADVYLAPDAPLGDTVFAGALLAFALGLDAGAVDEQVQRTLAAAIGDAHLQSSMAAAQNTEVRHHPVQADKLQQALHEPCRLSHGHAKEHFHRQGSLDGFIAESLLPTALARRRRPPYHIWIEPDRQRSAPSQCFIIS